LRITTVLSSENTLQQIWPERERERAGEYLFLASPETDPAAKSAGYRTPVKDGPAKGGRQPRGTGRPASGGSFVRKLHREREREGTAFSTLEGK
jgi:hypothetical protein